MHVLQLSHPRKLHDCAIDSDLLSKNSNKKPDSYNDVWSRVRSISLLLIEHEEIS